MDLNQENEQIDKTIDITRILSSEELKKRCISSRNTSERKENGGIFQRLCEKFLFYRKKTVDETAIFVTDMRPKQETSLKSVLSANNYCLNEITELYNVDENPFASGGQGEIFSASDRSLGCRVAVKSLQRKFLNDLQARDAFCTEARLTAALDHPSIIPVHGLFSDSENGMHLAMKMIDGCTLRKYIDRLVQLYENNGILKFDEKKSLISRIEIFLRICDAVGYAHDYGILHRDLKLENIMVGKYRETYVTDWGIAMTAEDADALDKVCGTPGFIAPELLTQKHADFRSDIYSLGIILFELVTLTPAFLGEDVSQIIFKVKTGSHTPLRHRFRCRIDADLEAIIRKAISLDPEERYQSTAALSEDLRRFLVGEEVAANPDNWFSRLCRWGINHRRGMLLSTMAALLIGMSSIAYSFHKEIIWSDQKYQRDIAVSSAYSRALQVVNRMEKSVSEVESMLERLQLNIRLSLLGGHRLSGQGSKLFVPLERYRKNFVAGRRADLDLNGICVFNYSGDTLNKKDLHNLGNTAEYMRTALLDLKHRHHINKNAQDGKINSAARMIYFVLSNGLFAAFPGAGDYPEKYDPRKRIWYKNALAGNGKTVWSTPYHDIGTHKDLVATCSLMLTDADGVFAGVGAVDFSLKLLAQNMMNFSKKTEGFLEEKLLINLRGDIIFRMKSENGTRKINFPDDYHIRKMLKRKYGTMTVNEQDREKLLVFSMIEQLNVLYVECLDMEKLIADRDVR